jgi:hypothetical protein
MVKNLVLVGGNHQVGCGLPLNLSLTLAKDFTCSAANEGVINEAIAYINMSLLNISKYQTGIAPDKLHPP